MTFKGLSRFGSKAAIALIIISCLTLTAFSQDVGPANQGKSYGEPGFRGEAINLNVVNADIRDILNYVTEQYGINFVIDKSVKAVPVTVNVSEVPWNVALDSIMRSQELAVQHNGPILRIAEQKTLADERARDEEIREGQIDQAPLYTEFIRLNYARAINTLGGEAGGRGGFQGGMTAAASGGGMGQGGMQGADQGILGIVQKRLSRRGTVEVDGRSNTLIITDVQQNISALRKLVYYLDQPAPQVEIESRIVVASRNFSRDLGLQLSASAQTVDGTSRGSVNTNFGNIVSNTIASLTTSAIGTTQISAALHVGEQKGQVKTIATPRITTLNNRAAEIESGQQIPITTVQPNSTAGAVIVTTEYVPVPLRLQVTPQITNVGTVILNVVAENNSVSPIAAGGGGAPPINVQRMQTEVMVPDGGTTVVGGAMFDSESEIVDRTPGLARIPLIGNLFKRKRNARDTNEILFFITPRIYRPDYNGKRIESTDDSPSSITLVQPVPLGNPPSNSTLQTQTSPQNNAAPVQVPQSGTTQPKPVVKPGN